MALAYAKKKRTFVAASSALAVALVLVFNVAKPAFSTFHAAAETVSLHDDGQRVSGNHQGHPPHKHKHKHHDGTTHEHQYHDEHCVKVSSNFTIECPQFNYLAPTGTWHPVLANSTTPNFAFSAHYAELLRPPILA